MLCVVKVRTFLKEERGTTQLEYAFLATLVSIVAILVLTAIAFDIIELFDAVEDKTGDAGNGTEVPVPENDDDVT